MRKAYLYFRVRRINKRGWRIPSLIIISLAFLCLSACNKLPFNRKYIDWGVVGGDAGLSKYSALDQINQENVVELEVVWQYRTFDEGTSMSCNPIVHDGIMYVSSPKLKAIALDASTGKELWRFDPFGELEVKGSNQGLTFWEDGDDKRIFLCAGNFLYALNAENGQPVAAFGDGGKIDLRDGPVRRVGDLDISVSAPAAIFKDYIIIAVEGNIPGNVLAYDVRTGKRVWSFRTIPQKGEPYDESWEESSYLIATGAHVNGGFSVDEDLEMLFFATGAPKPEFRGWKFKGQNLFANSIVALNARTGEYVWHFQEVHHDIWNLDLPSAPSLLTVYQNEQEVKALVQVSKTGNTWVFNRLTGESLFPYKEVDVLPSEIGIEKAWPSQARPESPPPFVRQRLNRDELTRFSESVNKRATSIFEQTHSGQWMQPISTYGSIYFGLSGGATWGGAAIDPYEGLLYVNANEIPWMVKLFPDFGDKDDPKWYTGNFLYQMHCASCHGADKKGTADYPSLNRAARAYRRKTVARLIKRSRGHDDVFTFLSDEEVDALVHFIKKRTRQRKRQESAPEIDLLQASDYSVQSINKFVDANGYPAVKPPWGTLNAIDLNRGRILWQVPLGEYPALTERGFVATGTENSGGCIVTDGGLIFIGATLDEKFRAFDRDTGKLLWEYKLPHGGYATPATYEIDGRQFVVIAAGGGKLGTPAGDTYIAFALPR